MTRTSDPTTYDDDFFAWTRQQAEALRRLPADIVGGAVDIMHVAEEIEDLGKRDLREVKSLLARVIEHLMKIDDAPSAPEVPHWRGEARAFAYGAHDAFSPSMRQAIDIESVWRRAHKRLARDMADRGASLAAPNTAAVTLDELLAEDFDLDAALARLGAARNCAED